MKWLRKLDAKGVWHVVTVLTLLLIGVAIGISKAFAHGDASWIMNNPETSYCCGPEDCAPLADDDVAITSKGYLIKSRGEIIPYSEAKPSIDDQYWLCVFIGDFEDTSTNCFFAPVMGM